MTNDENGMPTGMAEEDQIKAHLGKLFVDALLDDRSAEARARLAAELGQEIEKHISSIASEAQKQMVEDMAAERDALSEERQIFLAKLSAGTADAGNRTKDS